MSEDTRTQIEEAIDRHRAHRVVSALFSKLRAELSPTLTYHSAHHSEDVFHEAVRFALLDGRTEREVELLALAAAYHDAGFLVRATDNEDIAADMLVRALLDDGGYSTDEIELVRRMVLDTKLIDENGRPHQRPQTELSKYLLDADLSNLGRDDFFERLELLITEKRADRLDEIRNTAALMAGHTWFTDVARDLRQQKKQQNSARLNEMLGELSETGPEGT